MKPPRFSPAGMAVAFVILSALLFGCTEDKKSAEKKDTTLKVGMQRPLDHVNVYTQSGADFYRMEMDLLFARLFRIDPVTGKNELGLAEKWEWRENNMVLWFRLKEGLKWSDGKPLTTEDIVFTLDSHKDPKYKSIYLGIYDRIVSKVKVHSDREISFRLASRAPFHLGMIGANMLIFPKHVYGTGEKAEIKATSGPYKVTRFIPGKVLMLEQNPHWYGRNDPKLKDTYKIPRINYYPSNGEKQLMEMLEKGKIDVYQSHDPKLFTSMESKKSEKFQAVKSEDYALLGRRALAVNFKGNKALLDREVRVALVEAFNRPLVIKNLFSGHLIEADGPWGPKHHLYPEGGGLKIKYDPDRAKERLLKAGWVDSDKDGIREKTIDGKVWKLDFEFMTYDAKNRAMGTLLKEDLKKVGINIRVKVRTFNDAMAVIEDKNWDLILHHAKWMSREPNLMFRYHSQEDDWNGMGNVHDRRLDIMIEAIDSAFDPEFRKKLYAPVYKRVANSQIELYLFFDRYYYYVVNRRVKRPQAVLPFSMGMETWEL